MNIIPNLTLTALQVLPFAVTIGALYYILFKPMMEYLEDRENASSGATSTAKDMEEDLRAKKEEISSKVQTALREASDKRNGARQELVEAYNAFVQKKRQAAEEEIQQAVLEIAKEKSAARQAVRAQSEAFANEIASQIIGRNIA